MPLHDWRDDRGWNGLQIVWLVQLLDWLQARLPSQLRAYLRPAFGPLPDSKAVAVFDLDPQTAVHIDLDGKLIAAIEIVSPRNKDRPDARQRYLGRYLAYIRQAVHLMLIDVLPRPADFSFADAIAANLALDQPSCPVPFVVSYRVGEPVPDGTVVGVWRRPLRVGEPLPTLPLAITTRESVPIDLEATYGEAARRVYLD